MSKPAACIGATTTHGGKIIGPGNPLVLIGGMPAAVTGDIHICPIPPNTPHLTVSTVTGSSTVLIGGKPALRFGDTCSCGAQVVTGTPTVLIG